MNRNNNNNNYPYRQELALPTVSDMGSLVLRGLTHMAKKNKILSSSYLLGILFLLLVGSGTQLTLSQKRQYNQILNTIDLEEEFKASSYYASTLAAYHASRGWFMACDSTCQRNKKRMQQAKMTLDQVRQRGYARVREAKSIVGIFSQVGVEEVKESFWEYFGAGKAFAKRQSIWDAMFMGMRTVARGRDESMIEYLLKVLVQVLINFSIGLLMALVTFVLGLWSIVKSYQPNPLTALVFFVGASCAAFAFVSTYLFLIYGAAAGTIYGVAKVAESQLRIQGQQQPQQPLRRYDGYERDAGQNTRPHYL